jgi:hypothetical protein
MYLFSVLVSYSARDVVTACVDVELTDTLMCSRKVKSTSETNKVQKRKSRDTILWPWPFVKFVLFLQKTTGHFSQKAKWFLCII